MGSYSLRDQGLIQRIERAEKDLLMYKNAQLFGRDVTVPRLVQRRNSDGSPTTHDIEGEYDGSFGNAWSFSGTLRYIAQTQVEPYAVPYFIVWTRSSRPDQEGVSELGNVSAYLYTPALGLEKTMVFSCSGIDGDFYDPAVDRIWAKVYFFATDDGEIQIDLSQWADGSPGSGTVVPLT